MATKTWYINSRNFGGNTTYLQLTDDFSQLPAGENYSNTGWNVGRNNAGQLAWMENGAEVSRSTFASSLGSSFVNTVNTETGQTTYANANDDGTVTIIPQTSIVTEFPYNSVFDLTDTWSLSVDVRANSRANGQDGRIVASLNQGFFTYNSGSSSMTRRSVLKDSLLYARPLSYPTPIFEFVAGSTVTNLSTTVSQTSTVNFTITSTFKNYINLLSGTRETSNTYAGYIVIDLYWEITGAGGGGGAGNQNDVIIMYGQGTNSKLVSAKRRRRALATQ